MGPCDLGENRTRVPALRGQCPVPLDDEAVQCFRDPRRIRTDLSAFAERCLHQEGQRVIVRTLSRNRTEHGPLNRLRRVALPQGIEP